MNIIDLAAILIVLGAYIGTFVVGFFTIMILALLNKNELDKIKRFIIEKKLSQNYEEWKKNPKQKKGWVIRWKP